MRQLLYRVKSAWDLGPSKLDDIGARFLRVVDAIEHAEPRFTRWGTDDPEADDPSRGQLLAGVKAHIGEFVATNVSRDEYGEPEPDRGYLIGAFSNDVPYGEWNPRCASFQLRAGAPWDNHSLFEIGHPRWPPELDLVTFPLYRAVVLAIVKEWPAPWACAQCSIWGEDPPTLPGEPAFPISPYHMPWIAYLNAERAAKVAPFGDIQSERTPDGGLLMIATDERLDPDNRAHMRQSRLVAEIMIEHGGNPAW